jgi:hypothetical protein
MLIFCYLYELLRDVCYLVYYYVYIMICVELRTSACDYGQRTKFKINFLYIFSSSFSSFIFFLNSISSLSPLAFLGVSFRGHFICVV